MKNQRIAIAIVFIVGLFILTGCRTNPALRASLGRVMVDQAIQSSVQNAIEGPRGTTVNVQQQRVVQQQAQSPTYYDGRMEDGSYYRGQVFNRIPHGYGTYIWTDGTEYTGPWVYGRKEGYGTFTRTDGLKYVGMFANNTYNGQGTLTLPSGITLVGQFVNGTLNGQGVITVPGKAKIEAQFVNGKTNGYGKQTVPNGVFSGQFVDGLTQSGTFTDNDGTIITGTFRGEEKSGTISYPNGDKYKGEWNGTPDLYGEMEKAKKGYWIHEKPHGIGKMTYANGKTKEGIWRKGEFVGRLQK